MRSLVPMSEGVILHPRLIADWRYWLAEVRISWRVRKSLRAAIYAVNHGVRHTGEHYRSCYRFKWLEKRHV